MTVADKIYDILRGFTWQYKEERDAKLKQLREKADSLGILISNLECITNPDKVVIHNIKPGTKDKYINDYGTFITMCDLNLLRAPGMDIIELAGERLVKLVSTPSDRNYKLFDPNAPIQWQEIHALIMADQHAILSRLDGLGILSTDMLPVVYIRYCLSHISWSPFAAMMLHAAALDLTPRQKFVMFYDYHREHNLHRDTDCNLSEVEPELVGRLDPIGLVLFSLILTRPKSINVAWWCLTHTDIPSDAPEKIKTWYKRLLSGEYVMGQGDINTLEGYSEFVEAYHD
jgi:hypothetical protein